MRKLPLAPIANPTGSWAIVSDRFAVLAGRSPAVGGACASHWSLDIFPTTAIHASLLCRPGVDNLSDNRFEVRPVAGDKR